MLFLGRRSLWGRSSRSGEGAYGATGQKNSAETVPARVITPGKGTKAGCWEYVEGWAIIARLTNALEEDSSYEIQSCQVHDEVAVLGKLIANGITKRSFGSSRITYATLLCRSAHDRIETPGLSPLSPCVVFHEFWRLGLSKVGHLWVRRP